MASPDHPYLRTLRKTGLLLSPEVEGAYEAAITR